MNSKTNGSSSSNARCFATQGVGMSWWSSSTMHWEGDIDESMPLWNDVNLMVAQRSGPK